jgi:hypothetical protein
MTTERRRITSALSGAPPRTLAKRALLIGASVFERVVMRAFAKQQDRAAREKPPIPRSDALPGESTPSMESGEPERNELSRT